MARSSGIFIIKDKEQICGAFTVKNEMKWRLIDMQQKQDMSNVVVEKWSDGYWREGLIDSISAEDFLKNTEYVFKKLRP